MKSIINNRKNITASLASQGYSNVPAKHIFFMTSNNLMFSEKSENKKHLECFYNFKKHSDYHIVYSSQRRAFIDYINN